MAAADVLTLDPVSSGLYSLDIHKNNAYREQVKFDLNPPRYGERPSSSSHGDIEPAEEITINPEVSISHTPSREWEIDVKGLVSTRKWLQNYGLRKNRLDMHHILPQIGFKHADEFDRTVKKPICSRYGLNLFNRYFSNDGKTYNLACTKDQLRQLESRLTQAICLYKRRLEWLTSESRRIFGVIEEKSVAIVIDIKNLSPHQFSQYRAALERVIREQISCVAKFNLIRACEDLDAYRSHCVPVTGESIDGALDWLAGLDRTAPISATSTCEAILKASNDRHNEAIYLVTEGSSSDGARELLKEKLTGSSVPVHVVSYNCCDADTIRFLKDMARITGGRFHAYAVTMEMDTYEGMPVDSSTNQANILLKKKTYGGVPPGAGMREDVILLFEELEEGRNNLAQIQALVTEMPDKSITADISREDPERLGDETYMSSREWIDKYGIKARKLGFFDVLAGVAFKHQDGVVDLKTAPHEEYQTDAVIKQKLVNARYCDKFPHVRWKNGDIVHVQVTPEIHRTYEQKMMLTLDALQARIDWLQQGSRELFGTVIEDQIYILVDTSASMAPHIQFLKDKLFILMQEQLRHKQKFNIVAFNSRSQSWKDRLVEVSEKNLQGAWHWVKALTCLGSTNTMAALRHALSDPSTQAIYLLTDGRPDQPPKSILAQVMLHPQVPIHTISFNCADKEANEFLCQLAKDSGGRYHYYSEDGMQPDGPEPWESEDIRLLKQERENGFRNLEKVAMLRDECGALSWRKDEPAKRYSRDHMLPEHGKDASQPPLDPRDLYRSSTDFSGRPMSAPGVRYQPVPPRLSPRPSTAHGYRPRSARGTPRDPAASGLRPSRALSPRQRANKRPISARNMTPLTATATLSTHPKKNVAGHTRTSLMRSLTSYGSYSRPPWLLPETQQLFDRQWERQHQQSNSSQNGGSKKKRKGKKSKKNNNSGRDVSSKKWLSQHGLKARRLRILDALAPTFIPTKPKYIPILDKHVSSKVFDDIMPIGHMDGERMNIVNPQAVNLDDYIKEVEKAIQEYKQYLDRKVWEALPKESREDFDSDKPVSFLDNKLKLMQALDTSGWPISERDVILLENEIKQGEIYIQQARDLQEAALNRGKGLDPKDTQDYDDAASVASAASGKQYEGMGEAIETKTTDKETTKKLTKQRVKRTLDVLRGQKIIGRNEIDGFYYPGFVIKCPDTRHALVEYDDIGLQTVPTRFVIPTSGAIARPPIRMGDYVLARVVNQDTGLECYVPGVVQMTPVRIEDQAKFYTVNMYTTQQAHFLRSYLVKISKMRYMFLVRYIDEIKRSKQHSSRSRSRSGSRSRSRSPSGSRSSYSSRSRSRSSHSSQSRSRSRSRSYSRSRSRSYSRSRSRSHSRSRSRSHSRCRSRSRSRSGSRSSSRSRSSGRNSHNESTLISVEHQKKKLRRWQKKLEKQQTHQETKQKNLRRKARKLSKLKQQLISNNPGKSKKQHEKLLKMIVDELSENKQSHSSHSSDSRTKDWVKNHAPSSRVHFDTENGSVLISTGDKGVLISDQPPESMLPEILEMRRSLPVLKEGEEVLARWSDEGWYYRGTIQEVLDGGAYLVEDSLDTLERIWREDIIADSDDADVTIQPKHAVVALHPSYSFSYAPGVVLEVTSDLRITVRFYDGEEAELPREEVFCIPPEKFEVDVAYIIQREQRWVGAPVVARKDDTGAFHFGVVQERIGNGRQYVIRWSDDTRSAQASDCMFGAFTKSHRLQVGDRVLAMADTHSLAFLPGWITAKHRNKLAVKFCDGSFSSQIDPHLSCYWLSQEYYDKAVSFYKSKRTNQDAKRDAKRRTKRDQ